MSDLDGEDLIRDMPPVGQTDAPATDVGREASAESSTAQGEPERNTLSIVRDVVEKANADRAASPAEGQETGNVPGDEAAKKVPGPEDFDGLPFSRHPRFQELIGQRKDLMKQVETLKGFEEDALRFRNVDAFLKANEVPADDAAFALQIVAQSRRDPAGTLETLKPWLQDLFTRAGVLLPDDIQQGVNAGKYSPDVAQELSRARAAQAAYESRQQADQQRQLTQQQTAQVQALQNTATTWERDREAKDPNFAVKRDLLMERVVFLHRIEGVPNTPKGVEEQLDRAYREVNARAAQFLPQAQRKLPTSPVRGGQVAGGARTAVPQTTMDVIRSKVRVGA